MPRRAPMWLTCALALLLIACGGGDAEPPISEPTLIVATEGFATPESVLWDPSQGVWFVSNINGSPSGKDENGFISRLDADGTVAELQWISGDRAGVTLHAPKGMALQGDTLWVADIDALRAFDRHTGAPLGTVEFGDRAQFLNGVTVGPSGELYVTDTGINIGSAGVTHPGPDRIFRVTHGAIEILAEGDELQRPNGIVWDAANQRLIMVPFGGPNLFSLTLNGELTLIGTGPGGHDGVVILDDGRVVVSSWEGGSVFVMGSESASHTALLGGLEAPADLGVDPARNLLAIPLFNANRVEFWRVP